MASVAMAVEEDAAAAILKAVSDGVQVFLSRAAYFFLFLSLSSSPSSFCSLS